MNQRYQSVNHRYQQLCALRYSPLTRDAALIGVRIALAWIFVYHGAGTLFGAFSGLGISRTAAYFSQTAHLHPGTLFAVLNGITEFFGGIAVGLGIFGRVAAVGLFVDMVIAMITVTFQVGIVQSGGQTGYELNLALAGLAFVVALLGTGRIALDQLARGLFLSRPEHGAPMAAEVG